MFHHLDGCTYRFVAYHDSFKDSIVLRRGGKECRVVPSYKFNQFDRVVSGKDGETLIAQEPHTVKHTITDFISNELVQPGDVFSFLNGEEQTVLFTEKGNDWIYFSSLNGKGVGKIRDGHEFAWHWIYLEQCRPASKITRNGQVVAARHFWEDR
jgi:hypothetical protein